MNTLLSKTGAAITTVTVALFALFIIIDFPFGYYVVCMLLPVGYVMMSAGLAHECDDDGRFPLYAGRRAWAWRRYGAAFLVRLFYPRGSTGV